MCAENSWLDAGSLLNCQHNRDVAKKKTSWLAISLDPSSTIMVVRASASQSVDLGFIPLVKSYQKTLKNGIYSFPA